METASIRHPSQDVPPGTHSLHRENDRGTNDARSNEHADDVAVVDDVHVGGPRSTAVAGAGAVAAGCCSTLTGLTKSIVMQDLTVPRRLRRHCVGSCWW